MGPYKCSGNSCNESWEKSLSQWNRGLSSGRNVPVFEEAVVGGFDVGQIWRVLRMSGIVANSTVSSVQFSLRVRRTLHS